MGINACLGILATAEILGFATISEIAYENVLRSMKGVVQVPTRLTAGVVVVVSIALSPITRDPTLVYSVITVITVLASFLFLYGMTTKALMERARHLVVETMVYEARNIYTL